MSSLPQTASTLAAAIRSGETTASRVVGEYLSRIAAHDESLGAFLSVDSEGALRAAEAVDAQIAAGEAVGVLAGVPIALKDNLCLRDQPTTCASKMLVDYRPPYTAHAVERLQKAGAIIIGKTNLDEFAMGSSTENSARQMTRNPWNLQHVPGGSSGGSAAAVAAGFTPLALGSDTGGSIRQPASFCGVVGMKPSYGMVSRRGLIAFGSSLDQIGPLARTVEDAALLLSVIATPDSRDATCLDGDSRPPDILAALDQNLDGLTVGLPREYFSTDGLSPAVKDAVQAAVGVMESAGAKTTEISLPMLAYAIPTYYIICTAEASSNLGRYDGVHYGARENADDLLDLFCRSREVGFGDEVKRRIMLGTYVLSAGYYDAYYLRALKVRTKIAADFAAAFAEVDVIAAPVTPNTAFRIGENSDDPLAMYLSDIYSVSANLAAIPAISLPCGFDKTGLPIGLQLMGPRLRDDLVIRAAAGYERAAGVGTKTAQLDSSRFSSM